jgi:hypothetical protein
MFLHSLDFRSEITGDGFPHLRKVMWEQGRQKLKEYHCIKGDQQHQNAIDIVHVTSIDSFLWPSPFHHTNCKPISTTIQGWCHFVHVHNEHTRMHVSNQWHHRHGIGCRSVHREASLGKFEINSFIHFCSVFKTCLKNIKHNNKILHVCIHQLVLLVPLSYHYIWDSPWANPTNFCRQGFVHSLDKGGYPPSVVSLLGNVF